MMIDLRSPLAVLATRIPWAQIEATLAPKFAHEDRPGTVIEGSELLASTRKVAGAGRSKTGRPKAAIRLLASLLHV